MKMELIQKDQKETKNKNKNLNPIDSIRWGLVLYKSEKTMEAEKNERFET